MVMGLAITGARAKGRNLYTSAGALASRGPSWGQGLLEKLLAGFTITSLEQVQSSRAENAM
jgi:hypothetical protein